MWVCASGCEIETVFAKAVGSGWAQWVQVYADSGEATNRFGDGTIGVPKELSDLAEEDEEPYCTECWDRCIWIGGDTMEIRCGCGSKLISLDEVWEDESATEVMFRCLGCGKAKTFSFKHTRVYRVEDKGDEML